MNIDAKILKKILANPESNNINTLKGSYTTFKWYLSQRYKDFSINANQSV